MQEHRSTTAEREEFVRALGPEWLGFEFSDPSVSATYRRRFPEDPAVVSLENLGRFKDEHPEVLAGIRVAKPL